MGKPGRTAITVTLSLAALYLWSYKGTSHSTDEWFFIDQITALLQGRFEGMDVQYLGFYVLALPFVLLSGAVDTFGTYQILCLVNSITTAIAAGLLVLLVAELGYTLEVAVTTALVYGIGTLAWPYSGYLLREPTAAMWLVAAALCAVKYKGAGGWPWWATSLLTFGMALLTKRTVAVLLFPLLGYLACCLYIRQEPRFLWLRWRSWSTRLRSLAGIGICSFAGLVLWLLNGKFALFPSDIQAAIPDLPVLAALFASPGWGLFLFSPVLLLTIPGVKGLFQRRFLEGLFLWGMAVLYIFGITNHPLWWGTWNWGPRQVNPVLPLLLLPMAETLRAWGSNRRFRFVFGLLLLASALLAAMQALVSYPFLQVAFGGGIKEGDFIWNWATSPPLTQWRFINLDNFEPAWASIEQGGLSLFLVLAALAGLSVWLMLRTCRGQAGRWRTGVIGLVVLLVGSAVIMLHLAYFNPEYDGRLGFAEAAQQLRREGRPGDSLVVYIWGEPPWAYVPRIALLNYCKGQCPPQTLVIKEQAVDNNSDWPEQLYQGIGMSSRVWVIMQGLSEMDSRPVEMALARDWYYAGSTWTGPAVRMVRFERPITVLPSRSEERMDIFLNWKLLRYAVQVADSPPGGQRCAYVTTDWQRGASLASRDLNVSLQFLDSTGRLVSQIDAPLALFTPAAEASFTTKSMLCLPHSVPSGSYQLHMAVYGSDTSERLPFADGKDLLRLSTPD
jgi:hypothetical protein